MKQISFFVFFIIALVSLLCTGCNTVRGFGEDISGSANFVEKKICGEDSVPPASSSSVSNPPQWPK